MLPGFSKAKKIFYWAAETIPAYKDFLKSHNIKANLIKTEDDFKDVPFVDKKNYLNKYPFKSLFPNGVIPPFVSASSGSSGQPFYWPRGDLQEVEGGRIHQNIFDNIYKIGNQSTLVIVCFSMGTWVAGTYTVSCCRWIARKNKNLAIITPGIDKEDVLATLKNFAPRFEKVIITGYPPFIMDILREAEDRNINLKNLNLSILFAGENFSEKWRENVLKKSKISDFTNGSINIYGTADAAVLGHETPLTISIRRKAAADDEFSKLLFDDLQHLPTLVQYYPNYKYFESIDGDIAFTTNSGIPLIRYNIHDHGQVYTHSDMTRILKRYGSIDEFSDLLSEWANPFIILAGRKDVAVTFYAVNIYPENIKAGLEDDDVFRYVTGKFVATVKIDKEMNQNMIINLELEKRVIMTSEIKNLIKSSIFSSIIKNNAEFRKLYSSIGNKAKPTIKYFKFGDPMFKVRKSKHKWIKKD